MSIIQNIREKGTWIIFGIIAIALIAFILQDGVGRNNNNSGITNIAIVNGDPIDKVSFDEKVDLQVQNYASQGVKREQVIGYQYNQEIDLLLYNKKSINLDYLLEQKKFPMYYSAQNLHLKMNLQIKPLENLK